MIKKTTFIVVLLIFFSCSSNIADNINKISVADLNKTINTNSDIQLIDVRTKKEFDQGHINNAIQIDYFSDSFKTEVNKLNKEIPVYLYCKSGKRSKKASQIFRDLGFKKIYDLNGGYLNWGNKKK